MPPCGDDYQVDLTSAPIFDDALYLREALDLPECQSEDALDLQLIVDARESGIEDPYRFLSPDVDDVSTALSTSSEHRSSMSIHSGETQSTGITSHLSRTSKDVSTLPGTPPIARGSSTADEYYDSMMRRFRPSYQQRNSTSTSNGAQSVLSDTSSSSRKPISGKQKRGSGLGLFSMFRKDSSTCPSRSHHRHHTKPPSAKLDCGHALSEYAIRVHVQEALESDGRVVPNCCGTPLPRSVLETVLTIEEAAIVAPGSLQSPTFSSLRDSGYSEDGMSSVDLPASLETQSLPSDFVVTHPQASTPIEEEDLVSALANEAFNSLKGQQNKQFQRVVLFEANQRRALSAFHRYSLERLTSRVEANREEMPKRHINEQERLDELQLVAEHDLRKVQAQEVQNVATALKHMEAYCAGANPTFPDIAHNVTEEDHKKLARQYLIQQKLPAKHESAINVLRARQEKDSKTKAQKQQIELRQLESDYARDKRNEELQHGKDVSRLNALIETRRRRVMLRWNLRFEIWRRDWEKQHGTTLNALLPHEEWPGAPDDVEIDPSSPLALFLHLEVAG